VQEEMTPEISRALQGTSVALAQATAGVLPERDALIRIQECVRNVRVEEHDLDSVEYLPENTPPELPGEFPSGIHQLDMHMGGGGRRGELLYVSGQKKAGKTSFLISIGGHVLRTEEPTQHPWHVVHATFEIYKDAVFQRYTENMTRKPITMVTQNDLRTVNERVFNKLTIVNLVHDRRVQSLERVCDELQPDLLIVDYADCITTGTDNRFSALGSVYEQLRVYAKVYDCLVWTASRLNNDGRDGESYLKGYACDMHCTLDVNPDEADRGIAWLDINEIRRRSGTGDHIQLTYLPAVAYIGGE